MSDVKITVGVEGAQQASGQLKSVGDAANDANSQVGNMGKAAMGAGHLFRGLEMAAHGSVRGMFAAAAGAKHLLEAVGAAALGSIGLILAGVTAATMAISKAFGESSEEAKRLKEKIEKVVEETERLKQQRMTEAVEEYRKLATEIEACATAQDLYNSAKLKSAGAAVATKIAKLDLEEAEERMRIDPADEDGRKRLALKYATAKQGVMADWEVEKAGIGVTDAKKKATDQEKQLQLHAEATLQASRNLAVAEEERTKRLEKIEQLQRAIRDIDEEIKKIDEFEAASPANIDIKNAEKRMHLALLRKDYDKQLNEDKSLDLPSADQAVVDRRKTLESMKREGIDRTGKAEQAREEVNSATEALSKARLDSKTGAFKQDDAWQLQRFQEAEKARQEQERKDREEAQAKKEREQEQKRAQISQLESIKEELTLREQQTKNRLRLLQHGEDPDQIRALRAQASAHTKAEQEAALKLSSEVEMLPSNLTKYLDSLRLTMRKVNDDIRDRHNSNITN